MLALMEGSVRFEASNAPEIIEFEGVEYRRMGGKRRYYLSQSTSNEGRKRAKGLHVAIWEAKHGPVPSGHEVHHRDGNTFNFDEDNLECLMIGEHRRLPKRNFDKAVNDASLAKARIRAAEWHGSPEGLAWHRQHAFKSIVGCKRPIGDERKVLEVRKCEWCGSEFEARHWRRKFCAPKCRDHVVYLKRRGSAPLHPYYASRIL
jgi:hypothetical protein